MIGEYRKDFENRNGLLLQVGEKAQIKYLGKYSCELESKLSERDERIKKLECEGKPSLMERIVKKNEMLIEQKKERDQRIKQLEKSQTSLKDEMNHLMANVRIEELEKALHKIKDHSGIPPIFAEEDLESLLERTKVRNETQKNIDGGDGNSEFSDWYSYLGNVDFDRSLNIEIENQRGGCSTNAVEYINDNEYGMQTKYAKRYRIKLKDVAIMKFETAEGKEFAHKMHEVIGEDIHNKIIIIKYEKG